MIWMIRRDRDKEGLRLRTALPNESGRNISLYQAEQQHRKEF